MKVGSLFSGGGLGDFGFMAAGMKIVWQCEIDEYCQKILTLRYPESKKYRDIKTLKGSELEPVDIITGGFPCQPFSVAGKRKGTDDNRYLWPEMLRVINECRPRWIIGENVPGIINLALDTVCADLEGEGYEVWPIVFPSHALGAWHKRDRLWIVAHSRHNRRCAEFGKQQKKWSKELDSGGQRDVANSACQQGRRIQQSGVQPDIGAKCEDVADSSGIGIQRLRASGEQKSAAHGEKRLSLCQSKAIWESFWDAEPAVGRVANGIADRVHRLKMLGNGQVPACTYVIGKMIMELEPQ